MKNSMDSFEETMLVDTSSKNTVFELLHDDFHTEDTGSIKKKASIIKQEIEDILENRQKIENMKNDPIITRGAIPHIYEKAEEPIEMFQAKLKEAKDELSHRGIISKISRWFHRA